MTFQRNSNEFLENENVQTVYNEYTEFPTRLSLTGFVKSINYQTIRANGLYYKTRGCCVIQPVNLCQWNQLTKTVDGIMEIYESNQNVNIENQAIVDDKLLVIHNLYDRVPHVDKDTFIKCGLLLNIIIIILIEFIDTLTECNHGSLAPNDKSMYVDNAKCMSSLIVFCESVLIFRIDPITTRWNNGSYPLLVWDS